MKRLEVRFTEATRILTRNLREVARAFRRMAFSVLDHRTGAWTLSPAYDLEFSDGPGGEHTLTVAGEDRAPAG